MELGPIFRSLFYHKSRFWLIVLEIALTLAVVANCVHMMLDNRSTILRPTGIDEENIIVVRSDPFSQEFQDEAYVRAGIEQDLRSMRELPGVRAVAAINQIPLSGGGSGGSRREAGTGGEFFGAPYFDVTEGALQALGVKLIEGRDFIPSDFPTGDEPDPTPEAPSMSNVIITRELAEAIFPDGQAVGKIIENRDGSEVETVVGIIERMHNSWPLSTVAEHTELIPGTPGDSRGVRYLVRAEPGEVDRLYSSLETELVRLDEGRLVRVHTLEEFKAAVYGDLEAVIQVLGFVSVLLIIVTALGIVGLTSFSVANRTHEIGTRRALGATRVSIVRYFLVENWLITTFGLTLGVILTYVLSFVLTELADIPRIGWSVVGFGMLGLWIAGLAAALAPALRGAAVPPVVATRTV
jgi:putative ABC transport system permease protein